MAALFEHGYAVIVGAGGDLPNTVNDAEGLAGVLRDPDRCAYPVAHVQLLTGEAARREPILNALQWLTDRTATDPAATALVFFSGHGYETPTYYLLPYGYELLDLAGTSIAGSDFTARLQAIRAQKLIVLLDCCHAGGMADAKGLPLAKSPAPIDLATTLSAGSGRVILASSRKDELSYAGQPYSAFTGALIEALAGYGAFENDGYARVLDTTMWLGRQVPSRTNDRQHPIVKVSNLQDNFALAYYAGGEKQPKSLKWAGNVPILKAGIDRAQVETWQSMAQNYRENILLMEERMSQYVEFTDIPLQLVKNKRQTETRLNEIEQKLGLR
jgi:hypothetical protein